MAGKVLSKYKEILKLVLKGLSLIYNNLDSVTYTTTRPSPPSPLTRYVIKNSGVTEVSMVYQKHLTT